MGKIRISQSGFSIVEALLIFVIVGILGFTGYFVWHARQSADKTLNSNNSSTPIYKKKTANKVAPTNTQAAQKYLTIKDWNVKFPYVSDDTLTYKVTSSSTISVGSANLAAKYGSDCDGYGAGNIGRAKGTDQWDDSGEHASVFNDDKTHTWDEAAAKDPSIYSAKLNGYYYTFGHDQSLCAANAVKMPSPYTPGSNATVDAAINATGTANDFTKSIIPKIQAANS